MDSKKRYELDTIRAEEQIISRCNNVAFYALHLQKLVRVYGLPDANIDTACTWLANAFKQLDEKLGEWFSSVGYNEDLNNRFID